MSLKRRLGRIGAAAVTAVSLFAMAAQAPATVAAASLCVGGSGCYSTLGAAIAAAHDGDTITIGPGTFAGGVTIPISVRLVGAGAASTIIKGGGPVLTIGTLFAAEEPTVRISGVTITGGVTRGSALSVNAFGVPGVYALGGGIEIPQSENFGLGASVTISDSVISGNRAAPTTTKPIGPPCPSGPCPFAAAWGGGIDTWGDLTLTRSAVSHNSVGSATGLSDIASDTEGAGINAWQGDLQVHDSAIVANTAAGTAPNGRFAGAGGIFVRSGSFVMDGSTVSGNRATLAAALPDSVETSAVAAGIHIGDGVTSAKISHSTIADNTVSMTNRVGSSNAFSGGVHVDGIPFSMTDSIVSGNIASSVTLPGSTGDAGVDSGAGELNGTISDTRFEGNVASSRSAAGNAWTGGGASIFSGTLTGSVFDGNEAIATSVHGWTYASGGALVAGDGGITFHDTSVHGNAARAYGHTSSTVQGGGVYDVLTDDGPPGGPLVFVDSSVTSNVAAGAPGATLQGGGVYVSGWAVTLTHSVIAHNVPDQCFGFSC
ncbi:MAG TPA: hypothetical protein VEG29_02670 [Candidatus Binatia bacterium]|nr:hypothetical protein [Candidatus Binatia bacterium]